MKSQSQVSAAAQYRRLCSQHKTSVKAAVKNATAAANSMFKISVENAATATTVIEAAVKNATAVGDSEAAAEAAIFGNAIDAAVEAAVKNSAAVEAVETGKNV